MWNDDGTFMSREAFEVRLDELIASGSILESDRAFFLERFDFCGNMEREKQVFVVVAEEITVA